MKKLALLCALLLLAGCAAPSAGSEPRLCRVVVEEGEGFLASQPVREVLPGGDAVFTLTVSDGYQLTGADFPGARLEPGPGGAVCLTVPQVRYSTVVRLSVRRSGVRFLCYANGGERLDGGDPDRPVEAAATPSHLRLNTPLGTDLFRREGYTLTGWNTRPDGTGTAVGLGSRTDSMTLYAQWSPWTDPSLFDVQLQGNGAAITGYHGSGPLLTVPARLGGQPVRRIAAGAFAGADCKTVVLPETLTVLEDGAFQGCAVETLTLFDSLTRVSDYVFRDCPSLTVLHLNAALPPVYSGSYFSTFADKYDRLLALRDSRKLVLFSGSSTRFGYDSALLDAAFPDCEVVNMGVFAYTNAAPQLELILECMGEGDILLHAPEFDASQRQFCTTDHLDAPFFAMMEANYDMISRLDLRNYSQVFTALSAYLEDRRDMEPRSYALSPSQFDEDGAAVSTSSYNEYGDYILYRPNSDSGAPVYGLPVPYTVSAFPEERYLTPLNAMYARFQARGVSVFFTYAPRNRQALSPESTPEARSELHRYFQEKLTVPVISELEDSLWSGVYLSGTDNHLSTEGVRLRTQRIIADLTAALAPP